jgi:hypothetical protein
VTAAPPGTQTAAKVPLALTLRSGSLSTQADGKWTRTLRALEGEPLRADGRTSFEFARARITLESSSRFTLGAEDLTLSEGALSAEVSAGSPVAFHVGPCLVAPAVKVGRVLLCLRPDRVLIEEGRARAGDLVLGEGVEHVLRKDRLEPQKRRTLPTAFRPRETVLWKLDLGSPAVRSRTHGRIDVVTEGKQASSIALAGNPFFASQVSFGAPDEHGFFAFRPGSALRFRYFLTEPAVVQLVIANGTKHENFNLDLDPAVGRWTTLTIPIRDVPVNLGGDRRLVFETGDRVFSVGCFVGTTGSRAVLTLEQVEVVEIER